MLHALHSVFPEHPDHNVFGSLWIWTTQYTPSASAQAYTELASVSCGCWPSLLGLIGVNVLAPRLECEVSWIPSADDGLLDCRGSLISCLPSCGGTFQRTDSSAVAPKINIRWKRNVKQVSHVNEVKVNYQSTAIQVV